MIMMVNQSIYQSIIDRIGMDKNPLRVINTESNQVISLPHTPSISPWNQFMLSPCLIDGGEHDYLCYPNALTCRVNIVDLVTGEVVNELSGHMDVVTCCVYRENLCEV